MFLYYTGFLYTRFPPPRFPGSRRHPALPRGSEVAQSPTAARAVAAQSACRRLVSAVGAAGRAPAFAARSRRGASHREARSGRDSHLASPHREARHCPRRSSAATRRATSLAKPHHPSDRCGVRAAPALRPTLLHHRRRRSASPPSRRSLALVQNARLSAVTASFTARCERASLSPRTPPSLARTGSNAHHVASIYL